MASHNRSKQQVGDQKLIDGLTKHAPAITSVLIDGVPMTVTDIIPILQGRIDDANLTQSTRAAWQSAVQAEIDRRAKTKATVSGLRQVLGVAFRSSIDTLADFGLTPRKEAVITPDQRIAAIAKGKATRAARHTMGKKQRLAIKGVVPPIEPPAVTPTTPTTTPAVVPPRSP